MPFDIAFYVNADGDTPVTDFLDSLSVKEGDKCAQYILLLMEYGQRLPAQYSKHIEGKLYELRPEFGGVEMRIFYFTFVGDLIVLLHGFKKKTQKTPERELKIARSRLKELAP